MLCLDFGFRRFLPTLKTSIFAKCAVVISILFFLFAEKRAITHLGTRCITNVDPPILQFSSGPTAPFMMMASGPSSFSSAMFPDTVIVGDISVGLRRFQKLTRYKQMTFACWEVLIPKPGPRL